MKPPFFRSALLLLVVTMFIAALAGCSSLPPQPSMDISESGWVVREGQANWKAKPGATDTTGRLLVALHWDGRAVVRFTASGETLVVAQSTPNAWQAQLPGEKRLRSGHGQPSRQILWLQLPEGLLGNSATDTDWVLARQRGGAWAFRNDLTGETLAGQLKTTRSPAQHRVQPGEHIIRVARRYGLTVDALRAANPGPDIEWFKAGNVIQLPAVAP